MSVQRYGFVMSPYGCDQCGTLPDRGGDYVRFEDYAALKARCAGLEEALRQISILVDWDTYMSKNIARAALDDTNNNESTEDRHE